ncbi:MAG: arsenate reductase ArsC [Myxococcota bacterium]
MPLLFYGRSNASRSPLAEAIARHHAPEVEVYSAGSQPAHVRGVVFTVLDEVGIDGRGLRSKSLFEVPLEDVVTAVILCAPRDTPILPKRIEQVRWPLPDPDAAPRSEALEAYRATRDELMRRIPRLLQRLGGVS